MSELELALQSIKDSLQSTSEALEKVQQLYNSQDNDAENGNAGKLKLRILKEGLATDRVSLLSLKNCSMLAYINSLLLVVGGKLDTSCKDPTVKEGRQRSIQHRVVLERGVKPLEKKLSYQLDKLTRAYTRMEKEYVEAENRALAKSQSSVDQESNDDDSSDEELSYRPNVSSSLAAGTKTKKPAEPVEEEEEASAEGAVYKPPKISAVLPPQQLHQFEDKFNARDHRDRSGRSRMQAMEEYIRESSDQPSWESSIGANIVTHGRGGIKSLRDTEKERDIARYEEANFARLNHGTSKADKRKQKQRERQNQANVIGGEDFGIFNSKRRMEDSTSRRNAKRSRSAWDRAKKKL
ncbi:hypothetical protein HG536_0G04090 [Torulaspora globosa]|uniref:Uncharacterized protein n=1 Tax=Torulaspora globosa TaxID=48254 RepID=A0A7G3ZM11_9SACH|nr:uncharacterized protein HG536_0G04090 [Torulaspora globosa]QLL34547.1 hypothetical protein HG536_0G04090 [Torulaspora globosa]